MYDFVLARLFVNDHQWQNCVKKARFLMFVDEKFGLKAFL